jgi:hypothetical protein
MRVRWIVKCHAAKGDPGSSKSLRVIMLSLHAEILSPNIHNFPSSDRTRVQAAAESRPSSRPADGHSSQRPYTVYSRTVLHYSPDLIACNGKGQSCSIALVVPMYASTTRISHRPAATLAVSLDKDWLASAG